MSSIRPSQEYNIHLNRILDFRTFFDMSECCLQFVVESQGTKHSLVESSSSLGNYITT